MECLVPIKHFIDDPHWCRSERLGFLFVVSSAPQHCILEKFSFIEFKPKQFFNTKNDFTDRLKNGFCEYLGSL